MPSESSVSLDFRHKLQELLPTAVILKHHDAGMIGMPDCSVTYKGTAWLEFKLLIPSRRDAADPTHDFVADAIALCQKSAAQYRLMCRLAANGPAWHLVWIGGMKIVVVFNPLQPALHATLPAKDLPLLVSQLITNSKSL
jgi:hypothetical protein